MLDGSITMSHRTLNYAATLVDVNNKKKKTRHCKSWPACSASNLKAMPAQLRTDHHRNLSESKVFDASCSASMGRVDGPVFSQPNTIGVIGGVSAASTLNFLGKLVALSSAEWEESIPFIVCSDPAVSRAASTDNYAPIVENLRRKRLFLEKSGARAIVMPCHMSHAWHEEIARGCSVPFLHVGDCVVNELKAAKFKPIEAGSNVRIGVLAADAALAANSYQEKLQSQGFEVLYPDKATMEHAVMPALTAFRSKDMEGARNLLRIALQVLLVRAANTIILASAEMCGLLPHDDPLLKKCIDPMDALLREAIAWASSLQRSEQR